MTEAAFARDGDALALVGGARPSHGTLALLRKAESWAPKLLAVLDGARFTALAFSQDGTTLAAGRVAEAELWDVQRGALQGRLPHATVVQQLAFVPGSANRILVQGDGLMRLWDVSPGVLTAAACQRLPVDYASPEVPFFGKLPERTTLCGP